MKSIIEKKIVNLQDLEITSSLLILQEHFKKWLDQKPENEELQVASSALIKLSFLCNSLITDKEHLYKIAEEYRMDKVRAVMRARESEKQLNKK
tara:strand:+ start:405 stop:686 length:282 start_codon:yes stop_codon:yes gene_type:complete